MTGVSFCFGLLSNNSMETGEFQCDKTCRALSVRPRPSAEEAYEVLEAMNELRSQLQEA